MSRFACIFLICCVFLAVPAAHAEKTFFFDSLYDVPIMPGLSEIPDMALSFDHPEGRIAQAAAAGSGVSPEAVLSFYDAALPALGWVVLSPGHYARDGEILEIEAAMQGSQAAVRFNLSPSH
jgi:hypothetical protein